MIWHISMKIKEILVGQLLDHPWFMSSNTGLLRNIFIFDDREISTIHLFGGHQHYESHKIHWSKKETTKTNKKFGKQQASLHINNHEEHMWNFKFFSNLHNPNRSRYFNIINHCSPQGTHFLGYPMINNNKGQGKKKIPQPHQTMSSKLFHLM